MAIAERRECARWSVRVQVTASDGAKGEPFLWSDFGHGEPATILPSRARARGRAAWARHRLKEVLGARRVVATPVRVRVTTTVEVIGSKDGIDLTTAEVCMLRLLCKGQRVYGRPLDLLLTLRDKGLARVTVRGPAGCWDATPEGRAAVEALGLGRVR